MWKTPAAESAGGDHLAAVLGMAMGCDGIDPGGAITAAMKIIFDNVDVMPTLRLAGRVTKDNCVIA